MMPLSVACPSCGHRGRVPDEAIGRVTVCPACNLRHRLEAVEELPEESPATAAAKPFAGRPEPSPARPLRLIPSPRARPMPEVPPAPVAPRPAPTPPLPRPAASIEDYTGPYELDPLPATVKQDDRPTPARPAVAASARGLPRLGDEARPRPKRGDAGPRIPAEKVRRYVVPAALLAGCLALWSAARVVIGFGDGDPIAAQAEKDRDDPIVGRSMTRVPGKTTTTIRRRSGKTETRVEEDLK